MVATVSSFVRRQATAEPIAEPSDVSKNKSLLASRVNFYFLFGVSDVDVILAYIYLALPRHLMSLLALFFPRNCLSVPLGHPFARSFTFVERRDGGGDDANVLYTSACLINVKINWV